MIRYWHCRKIAVVTRAFLSSNRLYGNGSDYVLCPRPLQYHLIAHRGTARVVDYLNASRAQAPDLCPRARGTPSKRCWLIARPCRAIHRGRKAVAGPIREPGSPDLSPHSPAPTSLVPPVGCRPPIVRQVA